MPPSTHGTVILHEEDKIKRDGKTELSLQCFKYPESIYFQLR